MYEIYSHVIEYIHPTLLTNASIPHTQLSTQKNTYAHLAKKQWGLPFCVKQQHNKSQKTSHQTKPTSNLTVHQKIII